jgi:hypothetical protein
MFYDGGIDDRYIIVNIVEGRVFAQWLGDDGSPTTSEFFTDLISSDKYLGQASELLMALL